MKFVEYLKLFKKHTDYEDYVSSGTMVRPNVSYCEDVKDVHYNPIPEYSKINFTTVALENGTITFTPTESNVISYSTDNGNTWTEGNSINVESGDEVMWKGTMTPLEREGIGKFSSTCNFNAQGNVMSLIYGDDFKNQLSLEGKNSCFYSLFSESKVVNAKDLVLPATTLAVSCYSVMFDGCTSLTTAPQLPATTLAERCYSAMFYGCTSLATAPELPATTLAEYCYYNMFSGCASLTSAPELLATTLTQSCYSVMFDSCTSLTTAPELPATTLAINCYNGMFYGCTSLTSAPELPATTLAESCYYGMFLGCTSLNYIKAMFTTTPSTTYTNNWVNGVDANGTFVKSSDASWDPEEFRGDDGIPNGWTVQTA